jgi:hypothetical protein
LTNEVVSVQDVERALDIFGPSVPSLKGKTKKRQSTQLPLETPRQVVRGPLVMHLDIIFVRATPYLLTVTTPLGYIMCDVLSKGALCEINQSHQAFFVQDAEQIPCS